MSLKLTCRRCSFRVRGLSPSDVPPTGIVCGRCGTRMLPNEAKPDRERRPATAGPGTELKRILSDLGLIGTNACGCGKKVAAMNRWGVDGCQSRFAEIRSWLIESRKKTSWGDKITAVMRAATSGLALQLNPADVEGSLLQLAIDRAAQNQTPCPLSKEPTNAPT